ncbi:adenosylcobinamide amidohydrolase [Metabacillus arenae]|uniref:Adenosylcobinamide amidohydrolase n=1 Tax=Metabacillus arenae TaxID=2771434 RepID=A0A926NIY7_9BACI|nr:adenosylcobinamide amidohydrolase [Metabacillus arenae]MBD1378711.1 adenosylcobinamide amidohydrolase [Metabacillus arenae]
MLKANHVTGGYNSSFSIKGVSFTVETGEFFGILGPNGSGKSTLLKMLTGILPLQGGSIIIGEKPIHHYHPKELARMIAVLPQLNRLSFDYQVKEMVALGRYPYQKGFLSLLTKKDYEIIEKVMIETNILSFQDKSVQTLSGGEQQRVFLAQALAQQPRLLILDEPTNHLDLAFQKQLLDTLKRWAIEEDLTILSVFHDVNLASLYCDRMMLMKDGQVEGIGKTEEVVYEKKIQAIYETEVDKQFHPTQPSPQIVLKPSKLTEKSTKVSLECLSVQKDFISFHSPIPLKTLSSGVINAGFGWYSTFVNRHVEKSYNCDDFQEELTSYIAEKGFNPETTVGMMTAVILNDASWTFIEKDGLSLFIIVTAGTGNAVDVTSDRKLTSNHVTMGTINIWLIINGRLTDEAFVQAIMTATEAKVKALVDHNIKDELSNTIATGTSTDSTLVACTQTGSSFPFAGSATALGKAIGKGVYECTVNSIKKSEKRMKTK